MNKYLINLTVDLSISFALAFSLLTLSSKSSKTTKFLVEVDLYSYRVDFSLNLTFVTANQVQTDRAASTNVSVNVYSL